MSNEYVMNNDNLSAASQHELSKTNKTPAVKHLQKNLALIELLKAWRENDEQEQRDTWDCLKVALDEDRHSDRKLFP